MVCLFVYGGLLGISIDGSNVTIPAHYHGSIVGITISLMGLVYILLPRMGFVVLKQKLISLQVSAYSLGQILHISGLAWMGGYGALRKTAGEILPLSSNISRIVFASGGMLAVLAGLMFVLLVIWSILNKKI